MRRRFVSLGAAIVLAAGCAGGESVSEPTETPSTTAPSTSTVVPATSTTTATPSTTTTVAPTTSLPDGAVCREVSATGAPAPSTYSEAALDRFGPLEPAPSLTINVGGAQRADGPLALGASRIEGGVLVTGSRSSYAPDAEIERLPVVAIDHDGTVRWSRCIEGDYSLQTVVAAPEHQPANALVAVPIQIDQQFGYRWIQFSLRTGVEQPAFAAALRTVGIDADGLARLSVADVTDRYALLVDAVPDSSLTVTYQRIVRYDLATDVATDVAVPTELEDPSLGRCGMWPLPSLSGSGDVIVTDGAIEYGAGVVARWHDGTWSRDPATLVTVLGAHAGFFCNDGAAAVALRGADALGQELWTAPELTVPGTEGTGFYVDGAVTLGQVCSQREDASCVGFQLVGLDVGTGEVRWTQPGLRLVAGDAADGYVLAQAGDLMGGSQPGWVLLDDRTGLAVPGQSWDDATAFSHPCCGESEINGTVRAGGLVLVVEGGQVRVWYPQGTGGEPRTAVFP